MGQHKGTAFASRDWSLAKNDLMEDILGGWDSYSDIADGASDADREIAREALNELSREWDGTEMDDASLESFADYYDAQLRRMAKEYAP